MSEPKTIARCASCDGFGWFEADDLAEAEYCDWCAGAGYVYRQAGRDKIIPRVDYAAIAEELEALELERLRELGYQGAAKKPWQQRIRQDTQLGIDPYSANEAGD